MGNSPAMRNMPRGNVYLWIPDPRSSLGGHVTVRSVPLPRLDPWNEGRGRLWGQHVRVRNGGEIKEPVPAGERTRMVSIGDAAPNAEGDFLFEQGREGGGMEKVNWARR